MNLWSNSKPQDSDFSPTFGHNLLQHQISWKILPQYTVHWSIGHHPDQHQAACPAKRSSSAASTDEQFNPDQPTSINLFQPCTTTCSRPQHCPVDCIQFFHRHLPRARFSIFLFNFWPRKPSSAADSLQFFAPRLFIFSSPPTPLLSSPTSSISAPARLKHVGGGRPVGLHLPRQAGAVPQRDQGDRALLCRFIWDGQPRGGDNGGGREQGAKANVIPHDVNRIERENGSQVKLLLYFPEHFRLPPNAFSNLPVIWSNNLTKNNVHSMLFFL